MATMMSIAVTWIFFVLITAIILFVAGAKTAEVRRVNDELLDGLATLVNALEEYQYELTDDIDSHIEYARELVIAYDDDLVTRDTLPR